MICLECCEKIMPQITFANIFKKERYPLCERCYIKNPFSLKYRVLPLESGGQLFNYGLGVLDINNYQSYFWVIAHLFMKIISYDDNAVILYFDEFNDNIYTKLQQFNYDIILLSVN